MAANKDCFYLMERIGPDKYRCLYVHLTRERASSVMELIWKRDPDLKLEIWDSEQYTLWDRLDGIVRGQVIPAFGEGFYG